MRVVLGPHVQVSTIERGDEVILNESFAVIGSRSSDGQGEVVTIKEVLDDQRVLVYGRAEEERVVQMSESLQRIKLHTGDALVLDVRSNLLIERLVRQESEELILEEVPNISYEDVGGLDSQIEAITDAVELPYLHRTLFKDYDLPAPKGILLYGPPGCGKTLIAKAVAHSLSQKVAELTGNKNVRSYFLNIKGPELLNKYVGETERQIRVVFQRAREKAAEGVPVIIFFDEMDSLFRTRGTGISSDMESTIVPQLLAEIDGVESLRDVIVIGATNREDLIDPAILRPGRLDVKIKIERPDAEAAAQIFNRYITAELPLAASEISELGGGEREKTVQAIIEKSVDSMFRIDDDNRFLEVTYQGGDKEVLYFRDFASGAMIENIVRRAKKLAVKREISSGIRGLTLEDFITSIRQEFRENEDLPNTTNPDDWARISGKKGERIIFIRTLINHEADDNGGGRSIQAVGTGQYL
jgi:proteasome-associated ATPase